MSTSNLESSPEGMALVRLPELSNVEFLKVNQQGKDEFAIHAFQNNIKPEIKLRGSFVEVSPQHFEALEKIRKSLSEHNDESANIDHSGWKRIGEKALNLLKNKNLEKIVLSRRIDLLDGGRISLESSFQQLCKALPHALVYLLYHPEAGMWMGATPELLLKWNNGFIETVSLAGTRRGEGKPNKNWGAKELEEQKLVTDEIAQVFRKNCIPFTLSDPYTFSAGTIEHIKQDFKSQTEVRQSDYKKLLKDLHPTPAVCGRPYEQAVKHILELEPHDRKYYTGYLSIHKDDHLQSFVNLRCADAVSYTHL